MSDSHSIIIKKVKKNVADGHHGGAWKVAYADFVTAMMAFFLLMWLLNATTEDQRKGIADYFNPTIPISPISGGGSDMLNGATVFSDETLAKDGTGGAKTGQSKSEKDINSKFDQPNQQADAKPPEGAEEETKSLSALEESLLSQIENEEIQGLARHIQTRITPEGLVIELVDIDGSPLFDAGSTNASATMKLLLQVVANSLSYVTNDISIVGHTDAYAYAGGREYTNWELSTERANTARRLMMSVGLSEGQIAEVAGKAATEPLVDDKFAPQNRRISITILRS